MDYRVHAILQARILEWVAFPFSRGSFQPKDRTQVSCVTGEFFTIWAAREAQEYWSGWVAYPFSSGSSRPRTQTRVCYIAGGFFTNWATRGALFRWKDGYCLCVCVSVPSLYVCMCVSVPSKMWPLQVHSYDGLVFTWAVPVLRALPVLPTHACSFGQQRWSHMGISGLLTGQRLFPASLNSLAYFIHVVSQLFE